MRFHFQEELFAKKVVPTYTPNSGSLEYRVQPRMTTTTTMVFGKISEYLRPFLVFTTSGCWRGCAVVPGNMIDCLSKKHETSANSDVFPPFVCLESDEKQTNEEDACSLSGSSWDLNR